MIIMPSRMPSNPKEAESPISGKRKMRTAIEKLTAGITKLEIAVMDTIITMAAETMPASTAAWPITRVPTMETA
ncbi:hypothetical protein D3C86_2073260 [compost metagenome]